MYLEIIFDESSASFWRNSKGVLKIKKSHVLYVQSHDFTCFLSVNESNLNISNLGNEKKHEQNSGQKPTILEQ